MRNLDNLDLIAWSALVEAMALNAEAIGVHLDNAVLYADILEPRTAACSRAGGWSVVWYLAAKGGLRPVACIPDRVLTEEEATRHPWTFEDVFRRGRYHPQWLSPRRVLGDEYDRRNKKARQVVHQIADGARMLAQIPPNFWVIGYACDLDDDGRPTQIRTQDGKKDMMRGFALDNRDHGFDALWRRTYRPYESYLAVRGALAYLEKKFGAIDAAIKARDSSKKQLTD